MAGEGVKRRAAAFAARACVVIWRLGSLVIPESRI